MTTIEDVVKVWDETYPNSKTETLIGKNGQPDGKINSGTMFGRPSKWAIIKLKTDDFFAKSGNQIYYAFDFKSGKPEINFQKRSGYSCDTKKLYNLLDANFNGLVINGKKLTLAKGKNPDNLTLRIKLDKDSSAKEICDYMEKFIKLTQETICKFL